MIKIGLRMPETIHIGDETYGRDYIFRYSPEEIRLIDKLTGALSKIGAELGIPDAFILKQFTKEDLDSGIIPFSFVLCGERVGRSADFSNDREAGYVQKLFQDNGYVVTIDKKRGCFMFHAPVHLLLQSSIEVVDQVPARPSIEVIRQQLMLHESLTVALRSMLDSQGNFGVSVNDSLTASSDIPPGEN